MRRVDSTIWDELVAKAMEAGSVSGGDPKPWLDVNGIDPDDFQELLMSFAGSALDEMKTHMLEASGQEPGEPGDLTVVALSGGEAMNIIISTFGQCFGFGFEMGVRARDWQHHG